MADVIEITDAQRKILKDVDRTKLIELCNEGDGWGIRYASSYTAIGFHVDYIANFVSVVTDEDSKGGLFDNDGKPVKSLKGVWNLTFIRSLCADIGADTKPGDSKMGRGFSAREYGTSIIKRLEEIDA